MSAHLAPIAYAASLTLVLAFGALRAMGIGWRFALVTAFFIALSIAYGAAMSGGDFSAL